ncbi:MAG: pyridoxal-phosphate dependent enzyme, partial [Prolixibacteraceae bacterium]
DLREMGLPVEQFIAANNSNDVVFEYLKSGKYTPRPSVETIANAMDVGAPSNFARILDLYDYSHSTISEIIKGYRYSDEEIKSAVREVYEKTGYLCDPHGACGYRALCEFLTENQVGVFLETAHPAKFKETAEDIIGAGKVEIPAKLLEFTKGEKKSVPLGKDFPGFKQFLLSHIY